MRKRDASALHRWGLALLLLVSLEACAFHPHSRCPLGEQSFVIDSLYFGGAYSDGVVTPIEWQTFVDDVVTPRFPQGFTVLTAAGQYRTAAGMIQHEPSWVLQLVHADDAASEAAIRDIRAAYQAQFRQEAVLRVRSQGCVSF